DGEFTELMATMDSTEPQPDEPHGQPLEDSTPSPLAPAILVVADNAAKRMAIRAMLAPIGAEMVEAESGREALRAVVRRNYAAILMDVRMPELDGYETAKLIRKRAQSEL